jgi:menaquinone-specific isochorismate synthase
MPDTPLALFYARRFDNRQQSESRWQTFPDELAVVPERMIIRRGNQYTHIHSVGVRPDEEPGQIDTLIRETGPMTISQASATGENPLPEYAGSGDVPDKTRWPRIIELCLEAIDTGHINKVVPARRRDYRFETEIDPMATLAELLKVNGKCYAIGMQPEQSSGFVSISPERLFRRRNRTLEVDAVSSTAPRGISPDEDARLQSELKQSDKQQREHKIVIDGIIESIAPLCESLPDIDTTAVMKLATLQHLHTRITGELKEGIGDGDIINALHPTPAVGGYPRRQALDMIADLDGFDRGWYAGPIGCITAEGMECAVGIRSALVSGKGVSVFTGAGIVAGSDAEAEWRELDSKDILHTLKRERQKR